MNPTGRRTHDKSDITEEPCAGKLASTVLETSRRGDSPAEFNTLREKYGKHTVFLGASFLAHTHAQHDGERGHLPERQQVLLPGETPRRRLGIPMFMGDVH